MVHTNIYQINVVVAEITYSESRCPRPSRENMVRYTVIYQSTWQLGETTHLVQQDVVPGHRGKYGTVHGNLPVDVVVGANNTPRSQRRRPGLLRKISLPRPAAATAPTSLATPPPAVGESTAHPRQRQQPVLPVRRKAWGGFFIGRGRAIVCVSRGYGGGWR